MKKGEPTTDSNYITQHLANERTYLAWVRTGISVIGIGFLIMNLHYSMQTSFNKLGDTMANVIGLVSFILGIIVISLSTYRYFKKTKDINSQTFKASRYFIWMLAVFVISIIFIFALYLYTFTL